MVKDLLVGSLKRALLVFPDPCQEIAFKTAYQEALPKTMLVISTCGIALILNAILPIYQKERNRHDDRFEWCADDPRTGHITVYILMFLISASIGIFTCLKMKKDMSTRNMELYSLFSFVGFVFLLPLANRWWVARAYGKSDPHSIWATEIASSEGTVFLCVDCTITAVSLFVPIRASMVWIVHLTGNLMIVVNMAAFESAFPEQVINRVFIMVLLSAFAYVGLWRTERNAREQWLKIQREQGIVQEQRIEISQQQAELEKNSSLTEGMQRVLGGLCDLVFELGKGGVVLGSSTANDSLFGCVMDGKVLVDMFAEDGSALRFESFLQRAIDTGLLQTMNVTFYRQDCLEKACFDAQLLVVSLHSKEQSQRYLVGLRLLKEVLPLGNPSEAIDLLGSTRSSDSGGSSNAECNDCQASRMSIAEELPRSELSYSVSKSDKPSERLDGSVHRFRIHQGRTSGKRTMASCSQTDAVEVKDKSTDPLVVWATHGWKCQRCCKPPLVPAAAPGDESSQVSSDSSWIRTHRKRKNNLPGQATKPSSSHCRGLSPNLEFPPSDHDLPQLSTFEVIPFSTRMTTLRGLLRTWNCPRDAGSCCGMHQALKIALFTCKALAGEECEPLWTPYSDMQCSHCSVMCNWASQNVGLCHDCNMRHSNTPTVPDMGDSPSLSL